MIKLVDLLLEVKKPQVMNKKEFMKSILDNLSKRGYQAKTESKIGPHIRTNITGDDESVKKELSSIIKDIGFKSNITVINPKEKGAYSGSFKTYLIDIDGSEKIVVVNALKKGATIRAKSLTPTNLGLVGKTYTNLQSLRSDIEANVGAINKDAVLSIFDEVVIKSKKGTGEIDSNFNETIVLDKTTIEKLSGLVSQDIDAIANDFGEVLGSVVLSKKFKKMDLQFPSGNAALIDFIINGYKVSSKNKGGAAASLTDAINQIEPDSLVLDELYRILDPLTDKKLKTSDKWIEIAKNLELEGLEVLSKITKIPIESLTAESINNYITKKGLDKAYTSFKPFYDFVKSTPTKDKEYNPKKYYGLIVGPLSKYVADEMNKNQAYTKALKELISKYDIKQLYLDVKLQKGTMNFYIKAFSDPANKFVFEGGLSANNPDNKNISFKLK